METIAPTLTSNLPSEPDWRAWFDQRVRSGWMRPLSAFNTHTEGHIALCGDCCGAVAVDKNGVIHHNAVSIVDNKYVVTKSGTLDEYDEQISKFPKRNEWEIRNGKQIVFGLGCSADKLKEYTGYPPDSPSYEIMDGDTPISFVWKDM